MSDEKTRTAEEELKLFMDTGNKAAQDVLRDHAVSQGAYDEEEDSEQNNPENQAEPNDDDNIEHFENIRKERMEKAAEDLKQDREDTKDGSSSKVFGVEQGDKDSDSKHDVRKVQAQKSAQSRQDAKDQKNC